MYGKLQKCVEIVLNTWPGELGQARSRGMNRNVNDVTRSVRKQKNVEKYMFDIILSVVFAVISSIF